MTKLLSRLCVFVSVLLIISCQPEPSGGNPYMSDSDVPVNGISSKELSDLAKRAEITEDNITKGSIDFGESTINYFSLNGIAADYQAYTKESEPLKVVDFAPIGELPIEMSRPTIYVMFNHPLVPVAKLGEPMTENPLMKIDPPVKGVFRWYGTKVLSFQPDASLVDNPRYKVSISGKARSLGGRELGSDFNFEFNTEAVKIVNWFVGNNPKEYLGTYNIPVEAAKLINLEFNQPVEANEISKYLKVESQGNTYSFRTEQAKYTGEYETRNIRSVLLTLNDTPKENITVKFTLGDKAKPKADFPERKGNQSFSFQTIEPFTAQYISTSSYDFPGDGTPDALPVYISFSSEIFKSSLKDNFTLKVNNKVIKPLSVETYGNELKLSVKNLQPNDSLEFVGQESINDTFKRKLANAGKGITGKVEQPFPTFSFPDGDSMLEAQFPPKFIWSARNMKSISFGLSGTDADPAKIPFDLQKLKSNKVNYQVVDLNKFMNKGGFGTVYFGADFARESQDKSENKGSIQVTDLGISARIAYNRLLIWVNSLKTGLPVSGADISITAGREKQAKTDAQGLAVIDLDDTNSSMFFNDHDFFIQASKGADKASFEFNDTINSYASSIPAHQVPWRAGLSKDRVFLFTDRGLYKGGEEIALRGIHWIQSPGKFDPYANDYRLSLKDPENGSELWSESGKTSESGGFAIRFKLPDGLKPGNYGIEYTPSYSSAIDIRENRFIVYFTVAAFRKLNFQIVSSAPSQNIYLGDQASIGVSASYLAGGSMSSAPYSYFWTRSPVPFSPSGKGYDSYVFGPGNWEGEHTLANSKGKLGGDGNARISVSTEDQNAQGSAYQYTLETTVSDVDRQAISNTARVIVHPAKFYLGMKFESKSNDGWWSRFIPTNSSTKTEVILSDPDGKPWAKNQNLVMKIIRGDYKATEQQGVYGRINTRWEYVETEVEKRDISISGGKGDFSFTVKEAGDYLVSIEGRDEGNRLTKTVLRFYATGSQWVRRANDSPSDIELIADKNLYNQGDTAKILVRSPIESGTYLMTIEREGIQDQKIITLKGGQSLIEVPIKPEYIPTMYVTLTSFTKREALPKDFKDPDLGKPRSLFGAIGLSISTKPLELNIEIIPGQKAYKPGTKASVSFKVTKNGKPVANAEVTAIAVDRGVLDLINYHVPNPLEFFYDPYNFPMGTWADDSRRLLMNPVTYDTSKLTGGDGKKPTERKDFRPLALFEPFAKTDANGIANVEFQLPDNLTTYRITGMAVENKSLGISEGEMLVQNPINVRTALPRLWRNRDTAAAGVILQNLSSSTQKVTVSVSSDILEIGKTNTKTVEIKANGIYELPFVLSANKLGNGTISFTITSDILSEKLTEKVVVERPLVTEAFTTVGTMASDKNLTEEGFVLSSKITPNYGGISFEVDSSLKPFMTPSLTLLNEPLYPYEGYYRKLLFSFAQIYQGSKAYPGTLLAELAKRQLENGGVYTGFYTYTPYLADNYISILTLHFIQYSNERKMSISSKIDLGSLVKFVKSIADDDKKSLYLRTYANFVLAISGSYSETRTNKLAQFEDKLGLGGYGLIIKAYLSGGNTNQASTYFDRCKNFIQIGTQTLDLKETYEVNDYFSSKKAELALYLSNAYALKKDPEYIQRILGAIKNNKSYWADYNDHFWLFQTFASILDVEKKNGTEFKLALNLDKKEFASFNLDKNKTNFLKNFDFGSDPFIDFPRDKLTSLSLNKTGTGTAYYTMIMRYALPTETALARDEGINLSQIYETLDGTKVSEKDLKLGETYRIRVSASSTKDRNELKLIVPIPSGVEILDPSFVTTSRFNKNTESYTRDTGYGDETEFEGEGIAEFNYENFDWNYYWYQPEYYALDNAMVYKWTNFYAGTRNISFLVRVTTPGIFPTPPAQAALEFEPEVFGRTGGQLFVIKP